MRGSETQLWRAVTLLAQVLDRVAETAALQDRLLVDALQEPMQELSELVGANLCRYRAVREREQQQAAQTRALKLAAQARRQAEAEVIAKAQEEADRLLVSGLSSGQPRW